MLHAQTRLVIESMSSQFHGILPSRPSAFAGPAASRAFVDHPVFLLTTKAGPKRKRTTEITPEEEEERHQKRDKTRYQVESKKLIDQLQRLTQKTLDLERQYGIALRNLIEYNAEMKTLYGKAPEAAELLRRYGETHLPKGVARKITSKTGNYRDAARSIIYYTSIPGAVELLDDYVQNSDQFSERSGFAYNPGRVHVYQPRHIVDKLFKIVSEAPGLEKQLSVKRGVRGTYTIRFFGDSPRREYTYYDFSVMIGSDIMPWGDQIISTSNTERCIFNGMCFNITLPVGTPALALGIYRFGGVQDEREWVLPPRSIFRVMGVDKKEASIEVDLLYVGKKNTLSFWETLKSDDALEDDLERAVTAHCGISVQQYHEYIQRLYDMHDAEKRSTLQARVDELAHATQDVAIDYRKAEKDLLSLEAGD